MAPRGNDPYANSALAMFHQSSFPNSGEEQECLCDCLMRRDTQETCARAASIVSDSQCEQVVQRGDVRWSWSVRSRRVRYEGLGECGTKRDHVAYSHCLYMRDS